MKMRFLSLALALALSITGTAFVADGYAAPKKIKVWTGNPEGDPILAGMKDAFKPFVEKESNGKYVVEIYPEIREMLRDFIENHGDINPKEIAAAKKTGSWRFIK